MSRVVQSPMDELDRQVQTREVAPGHPHDRFVIEMLREAVRSGMEGNFGVGRCWSTRPVRL